MRRSLAVLVLALAALAPPAQGQNPLTLAGVGSAAICFHDTDGDAEYDRNESAFFERDGCGAVAAEDVYLGGPKHGSKVQANDTAVNLTTAAVPAISGDALWFLDDDGNSAWNAGDIAYLKMRSGSTITAGDIRLTALEGFDTGSVVQGADGDAGAPASALSPSAAGSDWKYFDGDGDGALDGSDPLYVDVDGNGIVSVRDVLIGPLPSTSPPSPSPPPPPPPPPPDDTGTENQTDNVTVQLQQLLQANSALTGQLNGSLAQNQALQVQIANLSATLTAQSQQLAGIQAQIGALQEENQRLTQDLASGSERPVPGAGAAAALGALAALALLARRRGP